MEDRSGELRPRRDFEEALEYASKKMIHPMEDPQFILHGMTIRQALRLAIKLWDQAEAKGLKRVSGP